MTDDTHRQARELCCQLRDCSSEEVQQLLEDLCLELFGAQKPSGTLDGADHTRVASLMSRFTMKGRPRATEDAILETVVLFKTLLLGILRTEQSTLKKLVRRLDETLLPSVFLKTCIRPSHLRAALCVSPEFVSTVAHEATLETLKDWKAANHWDFLPPSYGVEHHPDRVQTSGGKENISSDVPGGLAGGELKRANDAPCNRSSEPSGPATTTNRGIRPHSTSTNVLPTRGIPSYLITKRGTRASTPPPASSAVLASSIDEKEQRTSSKLPLYASTATQLDEDSNSTLVLESPVKRRRIDCHVIPPSPKRE